MSLPSCERLTCSWSKAGMTADRYIIQALVNNEFTAGGVVLVLVYARAHCSTVLHRPTTHNLAHVSAMEEALPVRPFHQPGRGYNEHPRLQVWPQVDLDRVREMRVAMPDDESHRPNPNAFLHHTTHCRVGTTLFCILLLNAVVPLAAAYLDRGCPSVLPL